MSKKTRDEKKPQTESVMQLDLFASAVDRLADALLPSENFLDGHLGFSIVSDPTFGTQVSAKEMRSPLSPSSLEFNLDAIASGIPTSLGAPADQATPAVMPEASDEVLELIESEMKGFNELMDKVAASAGESVDTDADDSDEAEELDEVEADPVAAVQAAEDGPADSISAEYDPAGFDDIESMGEESLDPSAESEPDGNASTFGTSAAPYLNTRQLGHTKYVTLPEQEQMALLTDYAKTKSPEILDQIVRANTRLVSSRASSAFRKGFRAGLDMEEYFQLGMVGLVTAIQRFDPSKGFRLSTYATFYIDREIKAARRAASLVHVPTHLMLSEKTAQSNAEKILKETGDQKKAEDYLATRKKNREGASISVFSGDTPIGVEEGDGENFFTMLACEEMGPEERAHISSVLRVMQEAFEAAKRSSARANEMPWHPDAFLLRFGLDDEYIGTPLTWNDITKILASRAKNDDGTVPDGPITYTYTKKSVPDTGEAIRRGVEGFRENFIYHLERKFKAGGEDVPAELMSHFAEATRVRGKPNGEQSGEDSASAHQEKGQVEAATKRYDDTQQEQVSTPPVIIHKRSRSSVFGRNR